MRNIAAFLLVAFVAASALAHAGHVHNFLGTVKSVDSEHLVITTEDAKQVEFVLNDATTYSRNGKTARKADLVPGLRVAVHVADDGKTAKSISLAAR